MPLPSVTFRSELPPVVRKELDQLDGEITAYLLQEHDDDGRHTVITATAVTVTGPLTVTGPVTINGVPLVALRLAQLEAEVAALRQDVARLRGE